MVYLYSLLDKKQEIKELLNKLYIEIMYENEINELVITEEIKKLEKVNENISCFIFDTRLIESPIDESELINFLKNLVFSNKNVKIIFISNREYDDKFISNIIQLGIYNILNINEYKDNEYLTKLKHLIEEDNRIYDVSRYFEFYNSENKSTAIEKTKEKYITKTITELIANKVIAVVSLEEKAGATFIALNIAQLISKETNQKVSYIEYPLNKTAYLKKFFQFETETGDYIKKVKNNEVINEKDIKIIDGVQYYAKSKDESNYIDYYQFIKIINNAKENETIIVDIQDMSCIFDRKEIFNKILLIIKDECIFYNKNIEKLNQYLEKCSDIIDKTDIVYNQYLNLENTKKIEQFYTEKLSLNNKAISFKYIFPMHQPEIQALYYLSFRKYFDKSYKIIRNIFKPLLNEMFRNRLKTSNKRKLRKIFKED